MVAKHANFVEFHDEELSSLGTQQSLGLVALLHISSYLLAFKSFDSPTAFSLMICSALVFAADMAAGEVATEPKRRRSMEAMVGNFLIAEKEEEEEEEEEEDGLDEGLRDDSYMQCERW
ncbi:hypothetical protein TRV_03699 [Trichophyton verrucosum HKI 0517]|uniref:Uncharacterized protein n=1 Tax=Trichophyton verrucosum (strain HKI 0517) TaxID=663202 RepID=D4D9A8_TRIVH|nr:uncharacterized protein TRV_03699 [Trichophyton verrucosum HKI 0517]EFE41557.1 hypothetical protein TRV_03699 [Trichophyton verrucosum HKI 0517]